jgi:thiol reductant ABC exporter CydD subunit
VRTLDPRLLRRVRSVRVALAVDVVLGLVGAAALLAQAMLIAGVVAGAFDGRPAGPLGASTGALLIVLAGVVVVRATLSGAVETIGRWAAGRVMSELRRALVRRRLSGGSRGPADPMEGGELATAAVAGVDAVEVYLARYLPQLVLAVTVPIAVLSTTLAVDPVSAAVMLVTLPVIPVFLALVGRSAGERARARWAALSRLSNHVLDVVRGLPTLRAYNRAEAQAELIAATGEQYRATTMQVLRLSFLSGAVLDLAATIGTALVAVTVGVRMVAGEVTLWAGLVVLLLTPELYAPLRTLGTLFHASADGVAAAARILDVLEPDEAATEAAPSTAGRTLGPGALRLPDWHRIELAGITVRHPGRGGSGVRGVDLDLRRGEVVALVGPSGAGKSTLAAVLLGLRRPDAGLVTIDGHELESLDPRWWRSQIGWLPQRPTMFRGTIGDNIALGDADAGAERVEEAARLAGVDVIAAELRLGYRTPIGPGGLALSAGEQRRVALARALVRGAPLLILDEPTAHLDADAAAVVADAIARVAPDRAVLVIEHHPNLVPAVDRVVALPSAGESETIDTARVPVGATP